MYKKIHFAEFKDIDNNSICVEIYKNTDSNVNATELTLSADSVCIDYLGYDGDVFAPSKCSGGRISVLTKELLTGLYTGKSNEIYCKIFRKNKLLWIGYATPCIYSSDYIQEYNVLGLEFVDLLSNLANFNYTYINEGLPSIVSFYEVITHCIKKCDTETLINKIYLQKKLVFDGDSDLLNKLHINDRNFIDEDGENEKCKDVIEYIARYLGMTALQYENALYFVDYSTLNGLNKISFITYDLGATTTIETTRTIQHIDINNNIFEAKAQINLNDIFNKIVVVANNNPISSIIPDLFDDDDLINQNENANNKYTTKQTLNEKTYTLLTAFFKSQNDWDRRIPRMYNTTNAKYENIEEVTMSNIDSIQLGTWWQKVDQYATDDGEPSALKWKTFFTMYVLSSLLSIVPDYATAFLSLKKKELMIFRGGYFIVDFTYILSKYALAHSAISESNNTSKFIHNKFNSGYDDTRFPCRLSVGGYFYDGDVWVSYSDFELKKTRGYYWDINRFLSGHVAGAKWYRYYDEYGYQRFVKKTVWDTLPVGTKKDSGDPVQNEMRFVREADGTYIFTTLEYWYECLLLDRFFLVHVNKEGDAIFNKKNKLTNTVSYKMNLADSSDGVAVKLPDDKVLFGELTFELFKSNHLGTYPCHANNETSSGYCNAIHISDMIFKYTTDKYTVDIFSDKKHDLDSKYENVINDDYVKEFEDIEMRINTHNEHAGSYSYVICKKDNGDLDFVDKLSEIKPEEGIIKKYHDYYSSPKFVYTNTIRNAGNIDPFTLFYESSLNRTFFANSLTYQLSTNSVEIKTNQS